MYRNNDIIYFRPACNCNRKPYLSFRRVHRHDDFGDFLLLNKTANKLQSQLLLHKQKI
jgi:hypothetical protein